jgi:hypothetical protein
VSKRSYLCRLVCTHPGCTDFSLFDCVNRKDYAQQAAKQTGFKCLKHTGTETMTPDSLTRTVTLEAVPRGDCGGSLFWGGKNGFAHGNGYRAYAEDFPPGTKLIVTARIELPPPVRAPKEGDGNGE